MKKLLFSVFALAMTLQMQAKVKLQPMFSDNMVLQRNTSAPIWGETRPGRMVSVVTSWNAKTYRVKADKQGRFTVSVETPNAGGPYEITISDGSPIVLSNILIGEVWICSGQSNMEMPMQGWDIPMNAEEIAQSDRYTGIRLLHVEHAIETAPKTTIAVRNNGWATCSPQTVKDFSATAFFFGKKINETERVPVGLIMTCWGGTPIESWISPEKLRALTPFSATIQEMQGNSLQQKARQQKFLDDYKQWIDDEIKRSTAVDSRGRYLMAQPGIDDSRWETTYCPAVLTGPRYDKYDGGLWFRKTIEIPTTGQESHSKSDWPR
ncbi:sialate O-acetylesterase [Hoylesella saccharolytica]|uniref:sialate O-acetylesterase n=1 Tax=Hoylesella saccharolytica TaxID=633701 RepID=UPI000AE9B4BE|nr:sialate O-acetylesterase [Hoylesella saccharolytica]